MPIRNSDVPRTPRDHEILALVNLLSKTCAKQSGLVMLAALAQLLLVVLQRAQDKAGGLPIDYEALAILLNDLTQEIRNLPQDTVQ